MPQLQLLWGPQLEAQAVIWGRIGADFNCRIITFIPKRIPMNFIGGDLH
ncbi:MAG: hypothetical protein R2867_34980 [Caldilineaceae bacterium]